MGGIPNDKTDVGEGPPLAYEIIIPQMVGEIEYLDVLERHFPEALKPWDAAPTNTVEGRLARLKARIGIQVLAGQSAAAKSEAEEARALLEPRLAKRAPQDRTLLSESAWVTFASVVTRTRFGSREKQQNRCQSKKMRFSA
jgi:hypothetical protein